MAAHFGLDLGSYSIKLIQAQKKGKSFALSTYGEIRTPANLESDANKDKFAIIEAIKKLVATSKVSAKEVFLALSESNVYSQVIYLPPLSTAELASAINFEAEQYIPVQLDEVEFEYIILSNPQKGAGATANMEVLLVAAKKRALEKMLFLVQKAGLSPMAMETESLSIVRSDAGNLNRNKLMVNLGNRSSEIIILINQKIKFIKTVNTGGEAFTRAIATSLNMNFNQAEQYKIFYGLDKTQLEGKIAKAILIPCSVIFDQIKKSLAFINQKQPENKVDLIVLTGGGADMPGLSALLAKETNLEVIISDPFSNFMKTNNFPKINNAARFSVAAGLSIREDE
jgi:type IV pilus assembly protein PilM